jgi:cytoskeletal protein CcmA (bactofilin family)
MWRKTDQKPKEAAGPSVVALPAKPASPNQTSAPAEERPKALSTPAAAATPMVTSAVNPAVSKNIKIKGDITGHGDLSIDGEVEGNVRLSNGTFSVGPDARVRGQIEAREVIVRGVVEGALKGCERVHVLGTGKLTGDVETRGIVIEDGAVLHSRVNVSSEKHEAAAHAKEADPPAAQKVKAGGV